MVFKLVQIDTENPVKIKLELGTHTFGRGTFPNVTDKRVSRQLGQFEVTDDSFVITALHQNPCFYKKKGETQVQTLKQTSSVNLSSGDKLGLLPTSYWYEVLHCMATDIDDNNKSENEDKENITRTVDSGGETDNELTIDSVTNVVSENNNIESQLTEPCTPEKESNTNKVLLEKERTESENISAIEKVNADSQLTDLDFNDEGAVSPSLSPSSPKKEDRSSEAGPSSPGQSSAQKRPLSDSEGGQNDEPKKIKTEPEIKPEVKPEVKTDPDSQQDGSSSPNNNLGVNPPQAAAPLRERCMYGASCYRRNPVHRAQYSHPQDADWGTGQKAPCPWGAACAKRDPRHWRDHEHPPGKDQPPPQAGVRVVHRQGNVFYINARSVNFYDDHFAVEDSDGDSVDYDYEF